jgi:hypothetical protein
MSAVIGLSISSSLDGKTLTATDTGTGYGTVTSRMLTIYDALGNELTQINMGTSLTANYGITADAWFRFKLDVIDNNGSYEKIRDYLAIGIYSATFLNIISKVGCSCNCSHETFQELSIGELFLAAALRYALAGLSILAQNNIVAANTYLNP